MAAPSYTHTLTNGTNANATQVQQNFTDILNGVSDGTKDLTINLLVCAKINGLTVTTSTGTLTILNGSTLATAGAFSNTLTTTGATNVTLPTTGTLATLAGSEAFTNKTINGLTVTSSTGTLTVLNGSTLATAGAFSQTHTVTGATNVTYPTSGTLATLAGSEVLTNKTLSGNIAVTLVSGAATVTLPTTTSTLATLALSETLTNKTLTSPNVNEAVALTSTSTKLNYLTSAGGTTGTATTNIVFSTSPALTTPSLGVATATSINGATIPSVSDTLMGKATTDTMTNKTFNADGTGNSITNIENADIKAAAGIVGTKISPDIYTSSPTGSLCSGTYTPTLGSSSSTNVAASTAQQCQYMRVGNSVTVSGGLSIDPTSAATDTNLSISLPIASNFSSIYHCAGTAVQDSTALMVAAHILGDATNDCAVLDFISSADVANRVWSFIFMYTVI